MLKTEDEYEVWLVTAYHLGEGRVLKTTCCGTCFQDEAYHLGEGRVLKTHSAAQSLTLRAYHLGEGRVLKT